jgi:RPA family protein
MATTNSKREVAWRVFAREFNSATTVIPGEEQYAPTYVLSPLGAMINRVYLTGVLTECENAGTDQEPLWRGRVSDPTDVFYISAGQFQPKAARALSEMEVPALVGISGKARTYSPDELTTYVSVRVEFVKQITQEVRDYWVLEACQSLQYRLVALREALQMDPPNMNEMTALGYSKKVSTGIVEAINQFDDIDMDPYDELLSNVLQELTVDTSMDITVAKGQTSPPELLDGIESKIPGAEVSKDMKSEPSLNLGFSKASDVSDIGDGLDTKTKGNGEEPNDSGSDPNLIEDENLKAITDVNVNENENDNEVDKENKNVNETDNENDNNNDTDKKDAETEVSEHLIFEIITSLSEDNSDGVEYKDVELQASEQGLAKEIIEECICSLIDKGIIYEPSIGLFKAV